MDGKDVPPLTDEDRADEQRTTNTSPEMLTIRQPCGEWCPLMGLLGIENNAPFCNEGRGHVGPHRVVVVIAKPSYHFTIEWKRP